MRTLLLIIATALLSTPAWAQLLPQTDVAGEGSSTQTLSLADGAVNVTLDAGGALDTRNGSAAGGIGLDVNGIGVGLQTPGFEGAAGAGAQPAPAGLPMSAATGPAPVGANAPTNSGAGGVALPTADEEMVTSAELVPGEAGAATGGAIAVCEAAAGTPLESQEIGALGAGTAILLERGCSGSPGSLAVAKAVAGNRILAQYLEERGIAASQVVSASSQDGVVRLRYVELDG